MQVDPELAPPSPPRVLVVDDDVTFVTFVCQFLERMNVRAEVSLTGADALLRLSHGVWGGVILDMRLPDADGLHLLFRLKQSGIGVRVVVITGAGNVPAAVDAMRLGALDFVEKPISVIGLKGAVERLLAPESEALSKRLADRATDQPTDSGPSHISFSNRTMRLADVVVGFLGSPCDVRTIAALCRAAGICVAPRTLRSWCRAEKIRAARLLDLARVLRAQRVAVAEGCPMLDCLDADERTTRALLQRGFSSSRLQGSCGSPVDLCQSQTYITKPALVAAIVSRLKGVGQ